MTDPATYIEGRTVQEQMNSLIGYVDQRSAEVALDAIASDVAQVHSDAADAHADALAAAASASQASTTLASAVKITGDQSIAGVKTFTGQVIVPTPTANTDAATKKYVDDADASILTAINSLDAAVVKLTGNQTVGGTKTFSASPVGPTEATGTFSTKLATSDKVKNELDAYAPMVRTTGNQEITGHKYFGVPNYGNGPNLKDGSLDITDIQSQRVHDFNLVDSNNVMVAGFRWVVQTNGDILLQVQLRKTDGTTKFVTIGDNS